MTEPESRLTHLDDAGEARMVDVGDKPVSERTARASARLLVSAETARLIADGTLPKGDALPVARIAGIQAAKRTNELIPLCHQVALSSVDVAVTVGDDAVELVATARASDRTGVEMEALVAVTTAALALYDMVKAVQRDAVVTDVRLTEKTGGAGGDYRAP